MAHPVAKVFGEYHIHAQRGGGEGGVPAATGYPGLSCACMFVLMYRRPGPCLLPQSFFFAYASPHCDIWTIWEITVGLQGAVDSSEHAINSAARRGRKN